MTTTTEIDYGPLTGLIGTWTGDKGMDVAPEPEGTEHNPYYETLTYIAIGDVTNAELQTLAAVRYQQIVKQKSDDKIIHDQTGYWLWDVDSKTITNSFSIPRGVCVLAGGQFTGPLDPKNVILEVAAKVENSDWSIIQSPFMIKKARTVEFFQKIIINDNKMTYTQTTMLDIYGRSFEHTDENELTRQ